MKILITGGRGMLGRTLQRELTEHELVIADLPDWDITDDSAFTEKTLAEKPGLIIHCAAMTKVDDCEAKRDLAFKLNEDGTRNVALAAKLCGARLIAISTVHYRRISSSRTTSPQFRAQEERPQSPRLPHSSLTIRPRGIRCG